VVFRQAIRLERSLLRFQCEFCENRAWPVGSSKIQAGAKEARQAGKGVSAVTVRSPLTIVPIRVAGTRKAIVKALADIPSGLETPC
jgi:hypothetical protein